MFNSLRRLMFRLSSLRIRNYRFRASTANFLCRLSNGTCPVRAASAKLGGTASEQSRG